MRKAIALFEVLGIMIVGNFAAGYSTAVIARLDWKKVSAGLGPFWS